MRIKKYIQFINEVSGTELVGHMGPNYPDSVTTPFKNDNSVIYCKIDSKLYTIDDYQNMYQDYLKNGGAPLDGFSEENLNTVILNLNN